MLAFTHYFIFTHLLITQCFKLCIFPQGTKIGQELGLGNRTNTIMQSAFFKITEVIPYELAVKEMKKAIEKSYGKKGEAIIQMNYAAVDAGGDASNLIKVEVPADWKILQEEAPIIDAKRPEFIMKN